MERIRVVLIGTSFGRHVQAVAFQRHEGFELAGIAGSDPERTRRIAAELGVGAAGADWRLLIERVRPDLVSIATPVDLHDPMTCAALELGAHVLCEKPTALNRHQAAAMRDAARARSRLAAINHEFRFFPARRHALALVRRGAPRSSGAMRSGRVPSRDPGRGSPIAGAAAASSGRSAPTTSTACAPSSASPMPFSPRCASASRDAGAGAARARPPPTTPARCSSPSPPGPRR